MKTYSKKYNVGTEKYLISFHDGEKKHKDESKFFDIATFKSKKELDKFERNLINKSYIYEF